MGADVLDALRLWIHEVVRLELEAVEEPDLARADPDRPPELTGRPAAYPPPPSCRCLRERISLMKIGIVGVVIGVLVLLTGWAFVDPQAQIPVVSQVVCFLKGADWYSETPLNLLPPGCYARSDELTTPTTSAPAEVVGDEDLTTTTLLPTTTTRPPDCTREERALRRADEAYRRLQDEYDRAVDRNDAAAQERILDAQERALDDQNAATQALTDCQSGR